MEFFSFPVSPDLEPNLLWAFKMAFTYVHIISLAPVSQDNETQNFYLFIFLVMKIKWISRHIKICL